MYKRQLYQQIARKFELVNLNFVSVAAATCSVKPNYGWKLVGMTAGPIMLSMLILLYYVANRIRIAVLIKQEEAGGATTGIGGGPPTVDAQNLEISADAEEEPVGTANQAGADGETQSVPDEIPSNTIFRVDLLPFWIRVYLASFRVFLSLPPFASFLKLCPRLLSQPQQSRRIFFRVLFSDKNCSLF